MAFVNPPPTSGGFFFRNSNVPIHLHKSHLAQQTGMRECRQVVGSHCDHGHRVKIKASSGTGPRYTRGEERRATPAIFVGKAPAHFHCSLFHDAEFEISPRLFIHELVRLALRHTARQAGKQGGSNKRYGAGVLKGAGTQAVVPMNPHPLPLESSFRIHRERNSIASMAYIHRSILSQCIVTENRTFPLCISQFDWQAGMQAARQVGKQGAPADLGTCFRRGEGSGCPPRPWPCESPSSGESSVVVHCDKNSSATCCTHTSVIRSGKQVSSQVGSQTGR